MFKKKIRIFEGDSCGIESTYAEWQSDGIDKTILKTDLYEFGTGSYCKKVLVIYYEVWEDSYYGN